MPAVAAVLALLKKVETRKTNMTRAREKMKRKRKMRKGLE